MKISVNKALRKAHVHVKSGEFSAAEVIFTAILLSFPKNKKAIQGYQELRSRTNSNPATIVVSLPKQVQELITLFNQGLFEEVLSKAEPLIEIFPKEVVIFNTIGAANERLQRYDEAIKSYKRALEIKPDYAEAYYNTGNALRNKDNLDAAIENYKKAVSIKPDYVVAHLNMGAALKEKGALDRAIESYKKALKIKPNYAAAYLNMGAAFDDKGDLDAAINSYMKALKLKPDYAVAYNNMGVSLNNNGDLVAAINSYKKALAIKPDYAQAYWNLYGTASDIGEAKSWLRKCLEADGNYLSAKMSLAALNFYEGDEEGFHNLINSSLRDHPYTRSFSWVFSLPKLPKVYFNRWHLYDFISKNTVLTRPFYEYGVWRGASFKYLIKTFKEGYGFDTFDGLPETWHDEKAGTYSSDGKIPEIEGGAFIVGRFEDTLQKYFSVPRPMASVINFDSDLYSSTICALNHSKLVIDSETILIFDEFLINEHWEEDEFKALEDFCMKNSLGYEVIALSFVTKQVAVKLKKRC